MRKEFRELASVEEAREVAERITPEKDTVEVRLSDSDGRVLAESIDSPIDVPGFDRSLMDGYAVRADDTYGADEAEPAVLETVGRVRAGEPPGVEVGEGETVEISTGAPIPQGADAVVPVEKTSEGDESEVLIRTPVAPADNVTFAGSDVSEGERVVTEGTELSQREIGLIAALGTEEVTVYRRPRVGVLSTGAELVRPGSELEQGQIYDVNTFSVSAAVKGAGGNPVRYEHTTDDYGKMVEVMEKAADECDVVLSSGSTSASTEDVVYRVVEEGGELLLHGVSLKPGRPTVFGKIDDTPFVGLPGNPVSALSVFRVFVSGMVRSAAGTERREDTGTTRATVATKIRSETGRTRLLPVGLVEDGDGTVLAYSVDKGSGATTSLTRADGYVTVDSSVNYLDEGEEVDVSLFGEASPTDILGAGERDEFINRVLEGSDGRWLGMGSEEGARTVRRGVSDVAGVSISEERLSSLGMENAYLVRGYEKRVGYARRNAESDEVLGVVPEGYGLREVVEEEEDKEVRVFRSEKGAANAVVSGKVDVVFCTESTAVYNDLSFEPTGRIPVNVLVSRGRDSKKGVESFLSSLEETDVSDVPGYRKPDGSGEITRRWE